MASHFCHLFLGLYSQRAMFPYSSFHKYYIVSLTYENECSRKSQKTREYPGALDNENSVIK